MWDTSAITKGGVEIFHRWAAGGNTLTIDGAMAGAGLAHADAIWDSTELVDVRSDLSIESYVPNDSGVMFQIIANPAESHYVIHQIGIWGHLNDEESSLIAVYQDEYGVDVPAKAETPEFRYEFHALIAMDTTGKLVVNVDPTLSVTLERLKDAIEEHNADPNAHEAMLAGAVGEAIKEQVQQLTESGEIVTKESVTQVVRDEIRQQGAGGGAST